MTLLIWSRLIISNTLESVPVYTQYWVKKVNSLAQENNGSLRHWVQTNYKSEAQPPRQIWRLEIWNSRLQSQKRTTTTITRINVEG